MPCSVTSVRSSVPPQERPRDTVEDTCVMEGIKFRFIDTAGIRETDDAIESEGIRRALDKAQSAAVVLYLMDTTCDAAINPEDR